MLPGAHLCRYPQPCMGAKWCSGEMQLDVLDVSVFSCCVENQTSVLVAYNARLITGQSLQVFLNDNGTEMELGRGGFGVVLRGTYRMAPVAIKRLKDQSLEQQEVFMREMALLRGCRGSRYIVPFVGASLQPVRSFSKVICPEWVFHMSNCCDSSYSRASNALLCCIDPQTNPGCAAMSSNSQTVSYLLGRCYRAAQCLPWT